MAESFVIDIGRDQIDLGYNGPQILALVIKRHGRFAAGDVHHLGIDTDVITQDRQAAEKYEIGIQSGTDLACTGLVDRTRTGCRLHGSLSLRAFDDLYLTLFRQAG